MYKIVAEVRFSGQIGILEKLHTIAKHYYPIEFPHWRIDNGNTVRIFNGETPETSTEIILYDYQRFIYSVEDPSTDNYFHDKYLKYYKSFQRYIETEVVNRIGVRRIELCTQESKEEILSKYKNIYSSMFLSNIDSSKPIDYFNVIEYSDKRITFGPLTKDENNQYVSEFIKKDKIPDTMFLIDLDVFIQQTKASNVLSQLDKQITNCSFLMKKINDMFIQGISE